MPLKSISRLISTYFLQIFNQISASFSFLYKFFKIPSTDIFLGQIIREDEIERSEELKGNWDE